MLRARMDSSRKKYALWGGLMFVAVALVAYFLVSGDGAARKVSPEKTPPQTLPADNGANIDSVAEGDFAQTGNLVYGNPGLKDGAWYLIYEAPGRPAIKAELDFGAAGCQADSGGMRCSQQLFTSGQRIAVRGRMSGSGLVTVYRISPAQ